MKITCPSCHTSYAVTAESLGEGGREVRCARCKTQWHAVPDADIEDMALRGSMAETVEAEEYEAKAETAAADDGDGNWYDPMARVFDDIQQDMANEDAARRTIDNEPEDEDPAAGADVESAARKRRWARRKGSKRNPKPWTGDRIARYAVGIAAALIAVAIPLREQVVRAVPDLAGIYRMVGLEVNLRGLAFNELRTSQGYEQGVPYLLVEGTIENIAGSPRDVPALRFSIRDRDRREVYAWTVAPKKPIVAEGETLPFRTRVAAPPQGSAEVRVRFSDRDQRQASLAQ